MVCPFVGTQLRHQSRCRSSRTRGMSASKWRSDESGTYLRSITKLLGRRLEAEEERADQRLPVISRANARERPVAPSPEGNCVLRQGHTMALARRAAMRAM